ncbi:hypothetical protein FQA39_LY19282 [Lamprigera yunnana]|nr:hypothetical protein FQA39_LY19282 [Lamprigera yunnana]
MLLEAEHQFKMTCPYEYISDERVLELLTWENTFEASECSLKSVATGNAFQSPRAKAQMGDRFDFLFCMIGHLRDPKFGALTNHSFSKFNGNPSLRPPLPIIHSDITFIDVDTGVTKAIIAGNECMEWKTAGASTMATKHLHGGKPKHILAVVVQVLKVKFTRLPYRTLGGKIVASWRCHAGKIPATRGGNDRRFLQESLGMAGSGTVQWPNEFTNLPSENVLINMVLGNIHNKRIMH